MPIGDHSISNLNYHVVFTTKNRNPIIDSEMLFLIRTFLTEKAKELESIIHIANGYRDHMHLLISIPPKLALAGVIGQLKGFSSFKIKKLYWQNGYSAYTIDTNSFDSIFNNIKNQEEHHKLI